MTFFKVFRFFLTFRLFWSKIYLKTHAYGTVVQNIFIFGILLYKSFFFPFTFLFICFKLLLKTKKQIYTLPT
jgi:hypothetical protein